MYNLKLLYTIIVLLWIMNIVISTSKYARGESGRLKRREVVKATNVEGYDSNSDDTEGTSKRENILFSKMNDMPWWHKWGKPYIKPEIGIFMTPQHTVIMPTATWTHLVDIELPCLIDLITPEKGESWTEIVYTLTNLIFQVTQPNNKTIDKLTYEHMTYVIEIQKNIENFLKNIKEHVKRIDNVEQYIYGFMEKTCAPVRLDTLRDDESIIKKIVSTLDSIKGDIPLVLGDVEEKIVKLPSFSVDQFNDPNIVSALKRLIKTEIDLTEWKTGHVRPSNPETVVRTTPIPIPPPPPGQKTTKIPPSNKFNASSFDATKTLQKRNAPKTPDTYANHVTNQFINNGNFTNVVTGEQIKNSDPLSRMGSTLADAGKTADSYTSQFFELSNGQTKSVQVPVITNYQSTQESPKPTPPIKIVRDLKPVHYEYLNPKELFINNARKVLNHTARVPSYDDGDGIGEEIEEYYTTVLADIERISTVEPFPLEMDQKGMMSIKVCYTWIDTNDKLKQRCADRFLPNVKIWTKPCDGTKAERLLPQSDSTGQMRYFVPDVDTWAQDVSSFRFKYVNNFINKPTESSVEVLERRKRGLGDDIMRTFWKPMFGAASEYDIEKMKKFMVESQSSLKSVNENQKLLLSYANTNKEKIDIITKAMDNQTNSIHILLDSNTSDLKKLAMSMHDISGKLSRLTILSSISTMQMYVHNALTLLKFKLTEISDTYRTLDNMIRRKVLLPSVLSADTLGDVIMNLSISNHSKWEVAPTWKSLSTMDDKSASMMIKERNVLVIIKIPLVQKTIDYTVYYSQSIPFLLGDSIIEAQHSGSYYIIDRTNNYWMKLTSKDYQQCLNNPGQICPYSHPKISLPTVDCYVSIVAGQDLSKPNKLCSLHIIGNSSSVYNQVQPFIGVPLSPSQWVVSVLNKTGVYAYELCDETNETMAAQTSQKLLTDINILMVSEGCRIQMGSTTFTTTRNWRTNNYHSISFSDTQLISTEGLSEVRIWRMMSIIPDAMKNATILSFKPGEKKTKKVYVFKDGQSSVADLINAISTAKNNATPLGFQEPLIPSIPDFDYTEPTSWSISHWQIWSFILGSVPLMLCISVIVYIVFKIIFKSRTAAASVAFSALPTSFVRAAIPTNNTPPLQDFAKNFYKLKDQVENSNNLTILLNKSLDDLKHTNVVPISWIMWLMLGLMILMLVLHVYHSIEMMKHRQLIRRIMRSSCTYPKNRSVTMHNIEEPVILVFLIKVYMYGKVQPINTTMAIQVATLPSPHDQWVVQSRSFTGAFCSHTTLSRSSKNLIIALNWTHVCIQSTLKINLDTCEDMPTNCVVPVNELDMAIDGGLPWNWSLIQQEHLLKIEVGRLGAMKMIFQYDLDTDDNTVNIPLLNY